MQLCDIKIHIEILRIKELQGAESRDLIKFGLMLSPQESCCCLLHVAAVAAGWNSVIKHSVDSPHGFHRPRIYRIQLVWRAQSRLARCEEL